MRDPDDLWGGEFQATRDESTAVALLKKQADLLATRTGGSVVGVVKEYVEDGTVWVSLYARVPALRNYEYKLLSIAFPLKARNPQFPSPLEAIDTNGMEVRIDDPEGFREWLARTLGSQIVHSIISNLVRYGGSVAAEAS
jgi:hypothetical protein